MTRPPRVFTVVLSYRHVNDTVRCVRSLQRSDYRNHRILVVDNTEDETSTDNLRRALVPEVDVVRSGGNLGYAGGNNLGVARALDENADLIWIVNPDAVVEHTTLSRLVRTADEVGDAAAIGPRILHGGDQSRIWFDGGLIDWSRAAATSHRHGGRPEAAVPAFGVVDVDYVTGAAMLLRGSAVDQVGMLPEEYFLYFEETDYCQQLLRRGWRVVVDEGARMTHFKRSEGIAPTPYYVYYMSRNRLHFARRWSGMPVDETLPHLMNWLGPVRDNVRNRAPGWLGIFDDLVKRAVVDARAEVWGPRGDIADVPTAEQPLVG